MNDRRQPLGGVSKDAYLHTGGHELTFDLIAGMKSDLCHEIKLIKQDTDFIKSQCSCRLVECKADFDKRYIKKVWEKLPVSKAELIAYLLFIGVLIGLGMIEFTAVAKWLPK